MGKKTWGIGVFLLAFILSFSGGMLAEAKDETAILDIVRTEMRNRMMGSGTLDIYNKEKNTVMNLMTMEFPEQAEKVKDGYVAVIQYRDTNSGAIVDVEVLVREDSGEWLVDDVKVKKIAELKKAEEKEPKEFSDEEIQAFMKDYIEQQAKFTGSVMLYDEEHGKMRKLTLIELKPEVRRMGVFLNSRGIFDDSESGDRLGIDVSVKNKKGELEVQALRIRDVMRGAAKKGSPKGSQ